MLSRIGVLKAKHKKTKIHPSCRKKNNIQNYYTLTVLYIFLDGFKIVFYLIGALSLVFRQMSNHVFLILHLQIDVFKVESYNVGKLECISIGHNRNDIGKLIYFGKLMLTNLFNKKK